MSIVDEHVLYYIEALRSCGFAIIFLTTSDLTSSDTQRLEALTVAIVERTNTGYDFSAWALAFDIFPEVLTSTKLLLANDSVYGPLSNLAEVFSKMESKSVDFWGLTSSRELAYHLQSYFLCFGPRALKHRLFSSFFWCDRHKSTKSRVIHRFEARLTHHLLDNGLTHACLFQCGLNVENPTLANAAELLEVGFPFAKVSLFRDNPFSADLAQVEHKLALLSPVIAELARNHLRRLRGEVPA